MNEAALRWKGRLGQLKALALLGGIVGVVLLIAGLLNLPAALNNDPARPAEVTVGALARGEVPPARYVTVVGLTDYDLWYSEAENGKTVARYYALVDDDLLHLVLVKSPVALVTRPDWLPTTVTGMTRTTPRDLQELVRSDLAKVPPEEIALEVNVVLYLAEGQTPPTMGTTLPLLAMAGVLLALAAVPLALPGTVFGPAPVEAAVGVAGDSVAKATGLFWQLPDLDPLEVGHKRRKFESAVANLVLLEDKRFLVYIHHVLTTRAYGLKVSEKESHWGVLIGRDNVVAVEPGKVYAWKDRPAVRLRYRDDQGREQALVVSFDHAAAQADMINMLQKLGFAVGSGMLPGAP